MTSPVRGPVLGVGTDVQGYAAVAEALTAHGDRYLRRVYTPSEQTAAGWPGEVADVVPALATTYAAKEAALKALGGPQVPWTDVDVVLPAGGRTGEVLLHGSAARHAGEAGVTSLILSVASIDRAAVAIVFAR